VVSDKDFCHKPGLARGGGKNLLSAEFLKVSGITQPSSVKNVFQRLDQLKIIYEIPLNWENFFIFI
jgi:hypothetical protein